MLKQQEKNQVDSVETSHQTTRAKMWNKTMMIKLSNKKLISMKCLSWNKKLILYLKPHENVQKALKRLKSVVSSESIKFRQWNKNVRKQQKLYDVQESDVSGDTEKKDEIDNDFTALMEISERLFELKYLDVYNDDI